MAQIFMNLRKPYVQPRPVGQFAYKPLNQFENIIKHNSTDPFIFYEDIIRPSLCVANKSTTFSPISGKQMSRGLYPAYEYYNIAAKFKRV